MTGGASFAGFAGSTGDEGGGVISGVVGLGGGVSSGGGAPGLESVGSDGLTVPWPDGSVGVPLDGEPPASYAILDGDEDGWRATFRRVPFDRTPLFEAYRRQRFVERYGPEAALVVKEFETSRLWVHPFQAWRRAHHADAPVDDALLAAFLAVDPKPYMPPEYQ